ncbi:NAD(P)/FAD-dependent oxidoreductase [Ktedonobacteria bacterium brp13]|nr:NAD(P)/FAD-dependent oxidoreductase [Ktedonobacteria bacterium brp13]
MVPTVNTVKDEYDVVICGAGIAGLTLARQITREIPDASLLLIEGLGDKSRTGAIQVGESTVEISANYLANVVGLRDYLEATHYHKWGFRFFFGNGHMPLHERPELGTGHASPLNSYQLDRALLEKDVKRLNREMGIQMLEESKVEDIQLGEDGELHEVCIFQKGTNQRYTIKCRWVIDAMGRRRFIQRKLNIAEPHNELYSSSWFRLKGRIDVTDLVPQSETEWHSRVEGNNRYYSTNHLMDNGRWVWLIPLASGHTSIGIVVREDFFPFHEFNTYERAIQWLHKHEPVLWECIHDLDPVDFQCLRHYSYNARQVYSKDRWACTGDAAVFSDPFLSPGIDQAGFGNTLITEMIKRDRANQFNAGVADAFSETFLAFHNGTAWITQPAYAYYGDGLVCGVKLVWDIMRGFSLNASARFNHIYLDDQKNQALQPILSRLFVLTLRMEKLFKAWSRMTSKKYTYGFVNYFAVPGMLDLYHRNFRSGKSVEELLEDHQKTLVYIEEMAQIIFLMAVADTMPDKLSQLPSPLWLNAWGVGLDPKRWKADKLFVPTSQPRTLKIAEFASMFGMTELADLVNDRVMAK